MAKFLDWAGLQDLVTKIKSLIPATYAGSNAAGGVANKTAAIPFGHVDSTSTATAFTATVDGITELHDGVCVFLENGVITSASGCKLNINNLGAKPIYNTMAATTAVTTMFNKAYTMLFVYNSTRVSGGCWDMYYGYNSSGYTSNVAQGQGYTTCSTAEATVAKTAALSSYALVAQGIVSVKFTNAVPAGATLNINSKGAKAIYYQGAAITAGVINAGDTATFIYSTYYHLIAIDKANPTKTSELTNDSGYLTSYTETDPVFAASAAHGITSGDITNWNNKSDFSGSYNDLDDKPTIPTVPTNVSAFTNDAGYITGYTETDPTVPSWAKASSKPTYTASEVGALPSTTTIPSKTSDLTNDSGFITGYTETDPVFTASAAHGITSADITNWNNKVSDDKTWNSMSLAKQESTGLADVYITGGTSVGPNTASFFRCTATPTANKIAKYDSSAYLVSTTPSANDNSTKVATTAYVDAAIPTVPTKTSDLTNDSGYITSPGYSYEPQQKDIVPEQTATTTFDRNEGTYWGWLTLVQDVSSNEYTEIPQTLKVEYAGQTYEIEEQTFAGKNVKYYGATRNSSGSAVSTWNYPFCIGFQKSSGTSKTSAIIETRSASTNTIYVYAEELTIVVTSDFAAAVKSVIDDGNGVSY